MTVEIVKGCIFEALEKGEIDYLVHQVNCIGVMGGLAGEVKRRYPDVYKAYLEHIDRERGSVLGDFLQVGKEGDYPVSRGIVNIFGQEDIGTHKRQTNYGALADGLISWRDECLCGNEVIGFPYKIGCGLGGGDWAVVLELIEFIFRNYHVKIYQL